jgi:hypothetical protein
MRSPVERRILLSWFLRADLRSDEGINLLCYFTRSRPAHRGRSRLVIPRHSLERGRHQAPNNTLKFLKYYEGIRWKLNAITDTWAIASSGLRRGSNPIEAIARLRGGLALLDSDLGKTQRLRTSVGARRHLEVRLNSAAQILFALLSDSTPELERPDDNIAWPVVPIERSTTFVGELARALYEELLRARNSGVCPVCGRAWISPEGRGRRRLCEREACQADWRRRKRKPEAPGASTPRVKRHRALSPARPAFRASL